VELYFLALERYDKLTSFKKKRRKLECISWLLKLIKSFNVNYRSRRRGA